MMMRSDSRSAAGLAANAMLAAAGLVLALGTLVHARDPLYFVMEFAREDGPIEYATALLLAAGAGVLLVNARALARRGQSFAAAMTAIYALVFLFGAGEEISWGQRLFDIPSGAFFQAYNHQKEINLHNMVIGDVHLASTVFGSFLTGLILLYLLVLPLVYPRLAWLRRLADRLAVPVPRMRHGAVALVGSLIVAGMDQERKWEIYELVFALVMLSVFLLPQNRARTR
ncbi:MAG: hypothetical protein Kow0058_14610 [Roseovarius sp.]